MWVGGGTLREESGVKNVQVECHKIDSSKPTYSRYDAMGRRELMKKGVVGREG